MIDDNADPETLRQFFSRTPEEIEEKKRQKWNEDWNALRMPEHLARVADQPPPRVQRVKGTFVVAPVEKLDPYQLAFRDTLGAAEAPDYDVMFSPDPRNLRRLKRDADGKPDYRDHPRSSVQIPWERKGTGSSAAGRYQFRSTDWDDVRSRHSDVTDFSPPNQDKAMWYLAAEVYAQKTGGRDLQQDLQDPEQYPGVAAALKGRWPSLPGGSQSRTTQEVFDQRMRENLQRYHSPRPAR